MEQLLIEFSDLQNEYDVYSKMIENETDKEKRISLRFDRVNVRELMEKK